MHGAYRDLVKTRDNVFELVISWNALNALQNSGIPTFTTKNLQVILHGRILQLRAC
jgi:hypothetical protein